MVINSPGFFCFVFLFQNYLLVEFKHKETVDKLLQHVSYFPDARQIPVRSRLLYHMQAFHVQRHRPGSSVTAEVFQTRELTTEDYLAADSVSTPACLFSLSPECCDVASALFITVKYKVIVLSMNMILVNTKEW